jgi:hypothetical protein
MLYDHTDTTRYTETECEAAVGTRATLPLTGVIIESGTSASGPYVRFQVDTRWGLVGPRNRPFVIGVDLDALELH